MGVFHLLKLRDKETNVDGKAIWQAVCEDEFFMIITEL